MLMIEYDQLQTYCTFLFYFPIFICILFNIFISVSTTPRRRELPAKLIIAKELRVNRKTPLAKFVK